MRSLNTWPHKNSELNPIAEKESKDLRSIYYLLDNKHRLETIEQFNVEGLPDELNKDLIERVLYFRFKGALFFYNERYYFLPFTLSGDSNSGIDSYGRYNEITPVLFTGQWADKDGKDIAFMSDLSFKAVYDKTESLDDVENYAFILNDHSLGVSQDLQPMAYLIHPIIEQLKDILVLINIDLVTSAKVFYVRVESSEAKERVEKEFEDLDDRILNGRRVVAIVGDVAWQELQAKSPKDSSRYFQTYQSFDNLRKDIIGIANGGTFMKQEHITDQETELNSNSSSLVAANRLRMRTEWAELVNHYTGLNISWEPLEVEMTDMIAEEGEHSKSQKGEGDSDAIPE